MRGQAHTLEAVAAGMIVLASVVFALQVTAVTPLSASTASQHIENQQQATAAGVLDAARDSGSLESAVGYWNDTVGSFHGKAIEGSYTSETEIRKTAFGRMLLRAFETRGIAFNVYFSYESSTGSIDRRQFIYRGEPSDHAVSAETTVTLTDDQPLYAPNGTPTNQTIGGASTYFAPERSTTTGLYNVVRVEVVVWRM